MSTSSGINARVFRGSPSGHISQSDVILFPGEGLPANCVLIEPTHCGLCFTDIHYQKSGCVLGHEPVGIVREVGPGKLSILYLSNLILSGKAQI